ncbi:MULTISPECIES: hypothetical protein [Mycobacteroides]|jgi:hypothetical protein|uniref:hypothetical protein n=1 Tax=Mycobacteroides TaxID=670516 RepID=UPI000A524244|nr:MULTISPECIES: hypothetical protein [Mycobacteroides]MBF9523058.1 hypothetical protein [Mycobacteroides chelonae]
MTNPEQAVIDAIDAIPVLRLPVFEQPAEPSEVQPPDPAAPWLVFRAYVPGHPEATVTFTPLRSDDCAVVPAWGGRIANA